MSELRRKRASQYIRNKGLGKQAASGFMQDLGSLWNSGKVMEQAKQKVNDGKAITTDAQRSAAKTEMKNWNDIGNSYNQVADTFDAAAKSNTAQLIGNTAYGFNTAFGTQGLVNRMGNYAGAGGDVAYDADAANRSFQEGNLGNGWRQTARGVGFAGGLATQAVIPVGAIAGRAGAAAGAAARFGAGATQAAGVALKSNKLLNAGLAAQRGIQTAGNALNTAGKATKWLMSKNLNTRGAIQAATADSGKAVQLGARLAGGAMDGTVNGALLIGRTTGLNYATAAAAGTAAALGGADESLQKDIAQAGGGIAGAGLYGKGLQWIQNRNAINSIGMQAFKALRGSPATLASVPALSRFVNYATGPDKMYNTQEGIDASAAAQGQQAAKAFQESYDKLDQAYQQAKASGDRTAMAGIEAQYNALQAGYNDKLTGINKQYEDRTKSQITDSVLADKYGHGAMSRFMTPMAQAYQESSLPAIAAGGTAGGVAAVATQLMPGKGVIQKGIQLGVPSAAAVWIRQKLDTSKQDAIKQLSSPQVIQAMQSDPNTRKSVAALVEPKIQAAAQSFSAAINEFNSLPNGSPQKAQKLTELVSNKLSPQESRVFQSYFNGCSKQEQAAIADKFIGNDKDLFSTTKALMTIQEAAAKTGNGESGVPKVLQDMVKSRIQNKVYDHIKKNPLDVNKAVSLWLKQKGMGGLSDFADNPWMFYGSLLALVLGGGGLLLGGIGKLFGGGSQPVKVVQAPRSGGWGYTLGPE